jgi:hypothetical protein
MSRPSELMQLMLTESWFLARQALLYALLFLMRLARTNRMPQTFGPDGNLYVPITKNVANDNSPLEHPITIGDIRRYDITPGSSAFTSIPGEFDVFASGAGLGGPDVPRMFAWYLAWAKCPESHGHP